MTELYYYLIIFNECNLNSIQLKFLVTNSIKDKSYFTNALLIFNIRNYI